MQLDWLKDRQPNSPMEQDLRDKQNFACVQGKNINLRVYVTTFINIS